MPAFATAYIGSALAMLVMDIIWLSTMVPLIYRPANGPVQVIAAGEIHVPVNKYIVCYVSSKDVIHSFKVIALRVTQDAIPGMRIPCWFKATKEGRYQINCAQLCGANHSAMTGGFIVVDSQETYDKWLTSKSGAATSFE